jgi:phospholipid-binding lipoprotein MlaA
MMFRIRSSKIGGIALICAALVGCASAPGKSERSPRDPFESWNRGVYKVNDALDRGVAKPAAKGYQKVTPRFVRTGISNFMANLETPITMMNDGLQGKFKASFNDLGRFLINTVFGVGGLVDSASVAGLDHNDEDFGQTLGKWGVHSGPYLVLPLLGPSTVRDAPSRVVDNFTNPRQYMGRTANISIAALSLLNERAELLSLDQTLKNTFDPYVFIRDAYLKRRDYQIADGNVPDEEIADPEANATDGAASSQP